MPSYRIRRPTGHELHWSQGQCSNKEGDFKVTQEVYLIDACMTWIICKTLYVPSRLQLSQSIEHGLWLPQALSEIQQHLTRQPGCAGNPISITRAVATSKTISCTCALRRQVSVVPANTQSESLLPEFGRNSALNVGHRPKAGPSWERLP